MPGIVAFRRRWSIGSDDLVVPAALLLLFHLLWLILLSVILSEFSTHVRSDIFNSTFLNESIDLSLLLSSPSHPSPSDPPVLPYSPYPDGPPTRLDPLPPADLPSAEPTTPPADATTLPTLPTCALFLRAPALVVAVTLAGAAVFLEFLAASIATKGAILETRRREGLESVLYFRLGLFAMEALWSAIILWWLLNNFDSCVSSLLQDVLLAWVISNFLVLLLFLLFFCCSYDSAGRSWVQLKKFQNDQEIRRRSEREGGDFKRKRRMSGSVRNWRRSCCAEIGDETAQTSATPPWLRRLKEDEDLWRELGAGLELPNLENPEFPSLTRIKTKKWSELRAKIRKKLKTRTIRAYEASWRGRFDLLTCCSSNQGRKQKHSQSEVAQLLSCFFHDVDVVPTDVIAGICLMHHHQKWKRKRIIDEPSNGVTDFFSGVPISSSTRFVCLSDADSRRRFDAVVRFARFAVAAYGWPMFMVAETCGACKLLPGIGCCGCSGSRREEQQVLRDNCCGCHAAAILRTLRRGGCEDVDLVFATFHCSVGETPFIVAVDHVTKNVVVSVRGTLSVQDVITDLNAGYEEIQGSPNGDWFGHKGMVEAAEYIKTKLESDGLLSKAFEFDQKRRQTQDYGLVIVGHSLGAGTAAILAMLLKPDYPSLHCYAISPPGGLLNLAAAEASLEYVTSVVVGKDVVARIGLPQMERFKHELYRLMYGCREPKWKIILSSVFCSGKLRSFNDVLECSMDETGADAGETGTLLPDDDKHQTADAEGGATTTTTMMTTTKGERNGGLTPGTNSDEAPGLTPDTAIGMTSDPEGNSAGNSPAHTSAPLITPSPSRPLLTPVNSASAKDKFHLGQKKAPRPLPPVPSSSSSHRLISGHEGMYLYPPGRIIHVVQEPAAPPPSASSGCCGCGPSGNVFRAIWADKNDFAQVVISSSMISDHMPENVLAALEQVLVEEAKGKQRRKDQKIVKSDPTPDRCSDRDSLLGPPSTPDPPLKDSAGGVGPAAGGSGSSKRSTKENQQQQISSYYSMSPMEAEEGDSKRRRTVDEKNKLNEQKNIGGGAGAVARDIYDDLGYETINGEFCQTDGGMSDNEFSDFGGVPMTVFKTTHAPLTNSSRAPPKRSASSQQQQQQQQQQQPATSSQSESTASQLQQPPQSRVEATGKPPLDKKATERRVGKAATERRKESPKVTKRGQASPGKGAATTGKARARAARASRSSSSSGKRSGSLISGLHPYWPETPDLLGATEEDWPWMGGCAPLATPETLSLSESVDMEDVSSTRNVTKSVSSRARRDPLKHSPRGSAPAGDVAFRPRRKDPTSPIYVDAQTSPIPGDVYPEDLFIGDFLATESLEPTGMNLYSVWGSTSGTSSISPPRPTSSLAKADAPPPKPPRSSLMEPPPVAKEDTAESKSAPRSLFRGPLPVCPLTRREGKSQDGALEVAQRRLSTATSDLYQSIASPTKSTMDSSGVYHRIDEANMDRTGKDSLKRLSGVTNASFKTDEDEAGYEPIQVGAQIRVGGKSEKQTKIPREENLSDISRPGLANDNRVNNGTQMSPLHVRIKQQQATQQRARTEFFKSSFSGFPPPLPSQPPPSRPPSHPPPLPPSSRPDSKRRAEGDWPTPAAEVGVEKILGATPSTKLAKPVIRSQSTRSATVVNGVAPALTRSSSLKEPSTSSTTTSRTTWSATVVESKLKRTTSDDFKAIFESADTRPENNGETTLTSFASPATLDVSSEPTKNGVKLLKGSSASSSSSSSIVSSERMNGESTPSEEPVAAAVRPKISSEPTSKPPPLPPPRPLSASEKLLHDIQASILQNSPSKLRHSLALDPSNALVFHAPPPPPRRFGNRWRGDHFLEIREFSPIFEEPVILQNSKCSVDDLDYGGASLDPNALYKSRPLLTSTPKSTPTEEFFPKPFESDV